MNMKKRELSKIAMNALTMEQMEMIENADLDILMSVQEISGQELLILNFYEREDIRKGLSTPVLRTFMEKDDYITENLGRPGGKWLTGRLESVIDIGYWHGRKHCAFIDSQSRRSYEKKFGKIEDMQYWYKDIYRWQEKILDRKLDERREKALSHTRRMMEKVPGLPDDFDSWAYEEALSEFHYLVYKPEGKRHIKGYCACCRTEVDLDKSLLKVRRGEKASCPSCGRTATLMPQSARLNGRKEEGFSSYYNNKWLCIFQKTADGFMARYFEAGIEYPHDKTTIARPARYWKRELCRVFYEGNSVESFEYAVYKQRGSEQWCPDTGKINCASAMVYTGNLPDVFTGTDYQYCSVDLLQKSVPGRMIPVWHYMRQYPERKYYEFLIKTGMTDMLFSLIKGNYGYFEKNVVNHDGSSAADFFRVPKRYVRMVLEQKMSLDELRVLQAFIKEGLTFSGDDVKRWSALCSGDTDILATVKTIMPYVSLPRFMAYIEKQTCVPDHSPSCYRIRNVLRDWRDYVGWCRKLKCDLTDPYYILPPDLNKAHDRMQEEHSRLMDKRQRDRDRRIRRKADQIFRKASIGSGYEMSTKDFMIIVPGSADEIRNEGNALHHCVGGYVDRVARGETMILFVRKVSAPDVPFYTLEWNKDHVAQCRGMRNSDMTEDVSAFVQAFERLMLEKAA